MLRWQIDLGLSHHRLQRAPARLDWPELPGGLTTASDDAQLCVWEDDDDVDGAGMPAERAGGGHAGGCQLLARMVGSTDHHSGHRQ